MWMHISIFKIRLGYINKVENRHLILAFPFIAVQGITIIVIKKVLYKTFNSDFFLVYIRKNLKSR
jgi:hypothetical protein